MSAPRERERTGSTLTPPPASEEPAPLWPDRILHHGGRFGLLLALSVLVTVLFAGERIPVSRFRADVLADRDVVADEDVVAQVPFEVPRSTAELESAREDARASTPPTFVVRPEASDSMAARLDRFLGQLQTFFEEQGTERARSFLDASSIRLTPAQLDVLQDGESLQRVRQAAIQAAEQILPEGVADASQLGQYETREIVVRQPSGTEQTVPRDSVLTPSDFYAEAVDLLPASASPDIEQALRLILIQFLDYSLELDIQATQADQRTAIQAVPLTDRKILRDQVIIREGDPVTEEKLNELQAHEAELRSQGLGTDGGIDLSTLTGSTVLNLLLFGVFGCALFFFRPQIYDNLRFLTLIALMVAAYFAFGALVARQAWPYELLPIAFVALPVAVLWDGRLALVLAIVVSATTGIQPYFEDFGPQVVGVTLLAGSAAALSVRAVRRRSQTWIFGAIVAGTYAAGILAIGLLERSSGAAMGEAVLWAGANSVLSAILAMGFLPMFEIFTGITTDQTLLEWADPNRPLLKRLSLEAPGTYAHTINVANLADAAAVAVGANSLLCRVGLYYHDIGKMLKPHYFVENQPDARNPHDRLKPDKSASIVKEHVTEGYKLAKEENVPEVVAAFIPEHHGTQRISFFWEKAKDEYGEEALDPADFTYPGPKPQSKETAIAMLADSVESATRVLQDPTPERVGDLIENIVDGKIADHQLDESPLTLREIRLIKEQFVKVLSGIYHHRIDYPQTRHLTEKRGGEGEGGPTGPGEGGGGEAAAASTDVPEAADVAAREAGETAEGADETSGENEPGQNDAGSRIPPEQPEAAPDDEPRLL